MVHKPICALELSGDHLQLSSVGVETHGRVAQSRVPLTQDATVLVLPRRAHVVVCQLG